MQPRELEKFGHTGYLFLLGGMLWLARGAEPEIAGWVLRVMGEITGTYVGVRLRMKSIWTWGLGFVAIDIYGIIVRLID